ncbi:MAG: LysM peptidoglycan-binding domain-containing protein [Chloroflexota bacterium]|nr:LysM peptidoglycan-binding domain-containing protein [Chloroflexota bacterium]
MTMFPDGRPASEGGSSDDASSGVVDGLPVVKAARSPAPRASASGDLVTLYAARATHRGAELRSLIGDHRGSPVPPTGSITASRASGRTALLGPVIAVGRGTPAHREVVRRLHRDRAVAAASGAGAERPGDLEDVPARRLGVRRKLATAGLVLLLVLAGTTTTFAQQRYVVQPGDSVDAVASTFGVDPAAILAASWVNDPANLTPGEVLIIPDPGQTPSEAALMAARLEGTSPFVATAHVVQPGDTLGNLGATFGLAPEAVASFNGLNDLNDLRIGQRLLIPPSRDGAGEPDSADEPSRVQEPGGTFVSGVGTYVQQRNLSCEYAAAYIATSALGARVPEWVFWENIPQSANPHWGYRGNIDGWWGNTDDYGIYPEALAPVLNANGYAADIFYGGGDAAALINRLDRGVPTLVWLGFWGDTAVTLTDAGEYTVAAGEHVVVAYGYDAGGVYVSDPATGGYGYYAWDTFLPMWNVLDGMSLGIYPF